MKDLTSSSPLPSGTPAASEDVSAGKKRRKLQPYASQPFYDQRKLLPVGWKAFKSHLHRRVPSEEWDSRFTTDPAPSYDPLQDKHLSNFRAKRQVPPLADRRRTAWGAPERGPSPLHMHAYSADPLRQPEVNIVDDLRNPISVPSSDPFLMEALWTKSLTRLKILWRELNIPEGEQQYFAHVYFSRVNAENFAIIAEEIKKLLQLRSATLKAFQSIEKREQTFGDFCEVIHRYESQGYYYSDLIQSEITALANSLRLDSVACVEAIDEWSCVAGEGKELLWNSKGYTVKMVEDMNLFISSTAPQFLGYTLVGNPLLSPTRQDATLQVLPQLPEAAFANPRFAARLSYAEGIVIRDYEAYLLSKPGPADENKGHMTDGTENRNRIQIMHYQRESQPNEPTGEDYKNAFGANAVGESLLKDFYAPISSRTHDADTFDIAPSPLFEADRSHFPSLNPSTPMGFDSGRVTPTPSNTVRKLKYSKAQAATKIQRTYRGHYSRKYIVPYYRVTPWNCQSRWTFAHHDSVGVHGYRGLVGLCRALWAGRRARRRAGRECEDSFAGILACRSCLGLPRQGLRLKGVARYNPASPPKEVTPPANAIWLHDVTRSLLRAAARTAIAASRPVRRTIQLAFSHATPDDDLEDCPPGLHWRDTSRCLRHLLSYISYEHHSWVQSIQSASAQELMPVFFNAYNGKDSNRKRNALAYSTYSMRKATHTFTIKLLRKPRKAKVSQSLYELEVEQLWNGLRAAHSLPEAHRSNYFANLQAAIPSPLCHGEGDVPHLARRTAGKWWRPHCEARAALRKAFARGGRWRKPFPDLSDGVLGSLPTSVLRRFGRSERTLHVNLFLGEPARQTFKMEVEERLAHYDAASLQYYTPCVIVQCAWRSYSARKAVNVKRAILAVELEEQKKLSYETTVHEAATSIQRWWRRVHRGAHRRPARKPRR